MNSGVDVTPNIRMRSVSVLPASRASATVRKEQDLAIIPIAVAAIRIIAVTFPAPSFGRSCH